MGKGKSGKKEGNSKKRSRAKYQLLGRMEANKNRKARKEEKRQQALLVKGKGIYAKVARVPVEDV